MAFRVRALQKGELDGLLLCFQDAFGVDDSSISIVRNSLVNDPYFHPERVRVGLLNGRIVSHVVILHRAVFVGNHVIDLDDDEHARGVVYCKGEATGQIIGSMEEKEFIAQLKILIENADKCTPGTPIDEA